MKNSGCLLLKWSYQITFIGASLIGNSFAQELSLICNGKIETMVNTEYSGVHNTVIQDVNRIYIFKNGQLKHESQRILVSCNWSEEVIACTNTPMDQCKTNTYSLSENPHCANSLKIFRSNGQVRETLAYSFAGPPIGKGIRVDDFSGVCEKSIKKF